MLTDPIADFLTRIRNAIKASHRKIEMPSSKLKSEISRVLKEKGYIENFKIMEDTKQGTLKIALRYNPRTKKNAITQLTRISSPGLRKYTNVSNMPKVLNGLGIAILSTSLGVLSDKEARRENVGGEILCYIY